MNVEFTVRADGREVAQVAGTGLTAEALTMQVGDPALPRSRPSVAVLAVAVLIAADDEVKQAARTLGDSIEYGERVQQRPGRCVRSGCCLVERLNLYHRRKRTQ